MTIAKIAVSVAGGGPWLSFALDAFDTAYNVAKGNMSLKDGAKGLAKGAAITAVSSIGVGKILGGAVGNTIANAGLGSVTASVASSMVNSYSTSLINSAINSIEFDGGLSFNSKKFRQGARDGVKGMAQAGLTALVSSSIMSAGGARWSNGKMGFTDKTGGNLAFAQDWQKSISSIASTASGLAGQAFSAATGDGFTLNYKGVLQLQLGGRNAGLSVGGGGVGLDQISGMMDSLDGLSELRKSKEVDFLFDNKNSKEGMARMTYANMGIKTGNMDAMQTSWDIINGDKSLVFNKDMQAGHFGHAGIDNNQIQMNADAMNISEKTLGKAGFYTSVMAREGFLIDQNKALGYGDSDALSPAVARQLTLNAFEMQSGVLGDVAKNMGIKFDGEWGSYAKDIKRVAETGDLRGYQVTGRDLGYQFTQVVDMKQGKDIFNRIGMAADAEKYLKQMAAGTPGSQIKLDDGSVIQSLPGGRVQFMKVNKDGKLENMFILDNKKHGTGTPGAKEQSDFERLIAGAEKNGMDYTKFFFKTGNSTDSLLNESVAAYYKGFEKGNPAAQNSRGSGQFNFSISRQAYHTIDPSRTGVNGTYARGLACKASSFMNMAKGLGLIPPDASRVEIEDRFTHLLDDSLMGDLRENGGKRVIPSEDVKRQISSMFNQALEGYERLGPGQSELWPQQFTMIANQMKDTDWGKLTGMNEKTIYSTPFDGSCTSVKPYIQNGYIGVFHDNSFPGGGHWINISGLDNGNNIRIDDPFNRTLFESFDESKHRKFWLLYIR